MIGNKNDGVSLGEGWDMFKMFGVANVYEGVRICTIALRSFEIDVYSQSS
jgi:hypothetical protein